MGVNLLVFFFAHNQNSISSPRLDDIKTSLQAHHFEFIIIEPWDQKKLYNHSNAAASQNIAHLTDNSPISTTYDFFVEYAKDWLP